MFLPVFADCEMISLLEDDTGMELLVCNKIISLDLPVKDVYKKIWCAQPEVSLWVAGGWRGYVSKRRSR